MVKVWHLVMGLDHRLQEQCTERRKRCVALIVPKIGYLLSSSDYKNIFGYRVL